MWFPSVPPSVNVPPVTLPLCPARPAHSLSRRGTQRRDRNCPRSPVSQLRNQRRYLLALIAFIVALVGPATVASAKEYGIKLPPHRYSPFYIPPSPLPAGKPGD